MNLFENPSVRPMQNFSPATQLVLLIGLVPLIETGRATIASALDQTPSIFDIAVGQHPFIYPPIGALVSSSFDGLIVLAFLGFQVSLLPIGVIAFLRRRRLDWLLIGMCVQWASVPALIFGFGLDMWLRDDVAYFVFLRLLPGVAFAFFVVRGHIVSRSFLLFAILLLGFTGYGVWESHSGAALVLRTLQPLIGFLLLTVLARVLVMLIWENAYVFRRAGLVKSLVSLSRTVVLWAPILLISVPYFVLTEVVGRAALEALYEDRRVYVYPGQEQGHGLSPTLKNLPTNLNYSIRVFMQGELDNWQRELTRVENRARNLGVRDLSREFADAFDDVVDDNLTFEEKEFGGWFPKAKQWANDNAQETVNTAYVQTREKVKARIEQRINSIEPQIGAQAQRAGNGVVQVRTVVMEAIIDMNREIQTSLWWLLTWLHLAHVVGLVVFGFICLKSFGYVLSRVIFSGGDGTVISLGTLGDTPALPPGQIEIRSDSVTLPAEAHDLYYASRKMKALGAPPKVALVQPFGAPISRIFTRNMVMNRVRVSEGADPVTYSTTLGKSFLIWEIAEGQTVVFHFRNFVAFSEGIQIKTLISLRLSSFLLGHVIYSTAKGPGRLVLLADGLPAAMSGSTGATSFSAERLLAWDKDCDFHTQSETGLADIFLSSAHVRPADARETVVDTDKQDGTGAGLARFVGNFIWP